MVVTQSPTWNMRVAVVGLGEAAVGLHLPALARISSASLAGVFDTDTDCSTAAARRFGVPAFESFDRLLEIARPEVVVVGTPPRFHEEYCLTSLDAGAHVICEKPFATSVAEADRIIAAAGRADRMVALNHEFREMPIFRALHTAVSDGSVGDLVFAQLWQNVDMPPWNETGWRGALRHRTLFEAGVHLVDLAITLFRELPISVWAMTSGAGGNGRVDAIVILTLEFSGDRVVQIIQNRVCRGENQYLEARVEGTLGSLRASFGGRARVSLGLLRSTTPHLRLEFGASGVAWRETGTKRTVIGRNSKDPGMEATRSLFADTLSAFAQGSVPPVSAADARDMIQIIAASYLSAERGRRISLTDTDAMRSVHEFDLGATGP